MPHTQYVKAAIFSSRMPPATAQANKIGIKKIDRCVVIQGKRTPKQESTHTGGKLVNSSSTEQNPKSDSESVMPSGKPLSMFEMMNATSNSHSNVQNADMSVQSKVLATRKSSKSSRAPRNHTSCLDVPQKANALNAQERIDQRTLSPSTLNDGIACNIKVERGIEETFNCLEKQEPVLQYLDDSASDSSIVSSRIETSNRGPRLKRICSDEDLLAMHSKKRPNDMYPSTNNANNEQQCISYWKCKSLAAGNEYQTFSDEFNQYNDQFNSQSVTMAESPNLNLHEGETDCQQLIDSISLAKNHYEEFTEFQKERTPGKLQ